MKTIHWRDDFIFLASKLVKFSKEVLLFSYFYRIGMGGQSFSLCQPDYIVRLSFKSSF